MTIKLYQFAPAFGLPNTSSFCLKLETYLRMTDTPFESVYTTDMGKAPKGKMPYIQDGKIEIGDSNFIINYLKQTYGDRLDAHLTPSERAISLSMRRLIEENLYWVMAHNRWIEPDNWEKTKAIFFKDLPPLLRATVPNIGRKNMQKQLEGHGMGKHSSAEIYAIGIADLTALSDFLADKPFFFGDEPTSLDASAYGILANILETPFNSPLKDRAQKSNNIVAYCHRIRDRYYPISAG
ncbi:glutathione S-transferase family protein [Chamaesiphon sp. GL140_3_metabinner_50]|uniref:glutathione S-transferase family protein n=1 Tax=Chamaesiphon sp. GL140_3_metabinner_50 TaxID=2970812 RepID=UPI0025D69929|nr:glutathione S-transferase family protein [Chamaesiphon sp. GL140_3_metabinner_50]